MARGKAAAKKKAADKGKVRGAPIAEFPKRKRGVSGGAVGSRGRVGKGHNGAPKGGMSADEKLAAIAKADRLHAAFQKLKKEADSAQSDYRNYLKEVAKKGFDKKAYIAARELDKDDHGQVQQHFANVGEQLRLRNSNLATQMELFQDIAIPEAASDGESPAVQGLKAGRSGLVNQDANPFDPGSEDWQSWHNNWTQGQRELAEETLKH